VNEKYYCMVPARIGSQRLKKKNLAMLNGKPLISYAIQAAVGSDKFSKVLVNSDDVVFEQIAHDYGAEFYLRPGDLGSSDTNSDEVVFDFFLAHPQADVCVWVNPIAPLQSPLEIAAALEFFKDNDLDSMITCDRKSVHCAYSSMPINFSEQEKFAKTQDLIPIDMFNYWVMAWRRDAFLSSYNDNGYGFFCGKFMTYPSTHEFDVIIKTKKDLLLAEVLMQLEHREISYYHGIKI